ncbi:MAG: nucleotidyltransferase domain-containing protein [Nanoarchaeota archaeon]
MKKENKKQKEVEILKEKITLILKKEWVKKAGIFGSYARGEQKKNSDIDILVEFDGSLLDLERLERILKEKLKKNIDLLSYGGINHRLKEIILNEEIKII